MSETSSTTDIITKLTASRTNRRRFMGQAGVAGLGILGANHLAAVTASAQDPSLLNDINIFNFALNLEYLEAEFYLRAVGRELSPDDITGQGNLGPVFGGKPVPFESDAVRQYALELADDEEAHVRFLRLALGDARVARPTIDLEFSFTAAARTAGIIGPEDTFDAFASDDNFLIAAFIFEDVGVTAYKGAARFIENKDFLEAAAGLLAVEAYHSGNIRTVLFNRGLSDPAQKISDLRDAVDGPDDRDQGILMNGRFNNTPTDENALAFSRTPEQVLNIVYLGGEAGRFGFFPERVNGAIR